MSLWKSIRFAFRRLRLKGCTPDCPACRCREQVQLKDRLCNPALWRCRRCGAEWWQEPEDDKPVGYPGRTEMDERLKENTRRAFAAAMKKGKRSNEKR